MKRPLLFWSAALAAALILGYWALSHELAPSSAAAHVTRGTATATVSGSVSVSPDKQSEISSSQAGILKDNSSNFKEGSLVQAGELLATLDPGEIPYQLNEAQIKLADTKHQLESTLPHEIDLKNKQKELNDATPLKEKNYYPSADYEKLQNDVAQLESIATQDRETLKTNKLVFENQIADYNDQLERLKIKAPYDGIITSVKAHPGDSISAGAPVATIISSALKIEAEVNQDDIAGVHEDEKANVRFFAYGGKVYPAGIKLILPSTDKATQRFTVILDMANPPNNLMSGLTGEVAIIEGEHPNALLVPRRALFGNNVVVVSHGVAEVRPVTVGFTTLTQAEILKGLTEGEQVLTEDPNRFHTGQSVQVTSVSDGDSGDKP